MIFLFLNYPRILIVTGHYGSGKTNFSVNLALNLKEQGREVCLCDLDLVNPYFRTADFTEMLAQKGIQVIAPEFANTNLDIPALPPELFGMISNQEKTIILDVGGDDAGAAALGRFSSEIQSQGDYAMFYVANCYRYLTKTAHEAVQVLEDIQLASRLKATHVVNNSNLSHATTPEDITNSLAFAQEICEITKLPLACTCLPEGLNLTLAEKEKAFETKIYVKTIWDEELTGGEWFGKIDHQ